uniref:Myosin motor domain-containing protein n=1 Tax=Ciona savignyi TaxID=51511 RepID=H2ZQ85_CIOSA
MKITEIYTKDTKVWVPDSELVWRGATLVSDYKDGDVKIKIIVEAIEDGEEESREFNLGKSKELPPLRNPEILIGENDLTSLSYLHEPAVLYNLQTRFVERNAIYTYCGIVLVAINPYSELSIYSNDFIQLYSGRNLGEMDPHIFAIAEEAFNQMSRDEKNQSIIVTGESGAGKTVSAKYTMRYFASVGGSGDESTVEQKVLASNPIMEAIGNAKTTRNDNSSRFGKYIQIGFSKQYQIIGAHMRTYLLEKSRVVSQAVEERNYHIFYQLCACYDMPQFQPLKLMPASNFEYTRNGNCIEIDGVNDKQEFQETVHAFTLLGVSSKHQSLIFRLLSAVLHMGNIDIEETSNGSSHCFISQEDEHLQTMCSLLGIEAKHMAQWFCHKKITTMAEVLITPLTHDQALGSRDALAKHMYAKLFDWIVTKVNRALVTTAKEHSFIGVLDIYGFETFEVNSFEQFCINYANEKLQQQFCQHVFKLEQEEYVREEIEWKFIDFYDNQPCIDLIESKLGILDLLNDECRMPKGSDQSWADKLYAKHLKTSKHFDKLKISNTSFFVIHFADKVRYEVEGFLEKNRDTVQEEQLNILKASQFELISELFMDGASDGKVEVKAGVGKQGSAKVTVSRGSARAGAGHKRKETRKTVANQFQDSLSKLMATLNSTTPHYVRCIKPNDYKLSFTFDAKRAVQQLRACGVLETIRISAAGYPSRWSYTEFFARYRVLMVSKEIVRKNPRKTCENVLQRLIPEADKYQPGKNKIFFRAGQVAYLEKLRADKLRSCAVMIQKNVRMWLYRNKYIRMKRSAVIIQRLIRGYQARCLVYFLRRTRSATIIQSRWRGYVKRRDYCKVRDATVVVQSYTRGMFARQRHRKLLRNAKAVVIQKYVRGWLARKSTTRQLRLIIYLQCCVRRMIAKKELKVLKIEARSVSHFKKLNKGMENKIMELQRKVDQSAKENLSLSAKAAETVSLRQQLVAAKENQSLVEKFRARIIELEQEVTDVRHLLEDSKTESKIALDAIEKERDDKDEIIEELKNGLKNLEKQNKDIQVGFLEKEKEIRESCASEIDSRCAQLQHELDEERTQHQLRIKDYNRLEQRYGNIKDELEVLRSQENTESGFDSPRPENGHQSNVRFSTSLAVKIEELQREKQDLETRITEKLQGGFNYEEQMRLKLAIEENDNVKMELSKLRKSIAESAESTMNEESNVFKSMYEQMEAMQEELEVRRSEVIQLKSFVAKQPVPAETKTLGTMTGSELLGSRNRMEDISLDKLDKSDLKAVLIKVYDHNSSPKKFCVVISSQHVLFKINQNILYRMLESELEAERKNHELEIHDLKSSRGKQVSYHNGSYGGSLEENVQQELSRLSSENYDLLTKVESLDKMNRKLKRQLKLYSRKLNTFDEDTGSIQSHPVLRHKDSTDGGALGMLQYKAGDEGKVMQTIILDFKPRGVAVNMIPGLPAYLLFKLLRFADYSNDDKMIKQLLQQIISGIKKVEKKHDKEFEYMSFWMANTCRFLHNMKQYSGEEEYMKESTEHQKRHCLRNFDLAEYRPVFSDIAISLFQKLILVVVRAIKPMIVPAMLEHDTIQGVSSKPSGMRGRSSSRDNDAADYTVEMLLKQLSGYHNMMLQHGTEQVLIRQVFRQVFYCITAHTLNNQLVRKELCNWSKAMQIRYNVSQLEEWLRNANLGDGLVRDTLEPLVHASQLLQVKKQSDTDADEICNMCTSLNPQQIVKLLQLITSTNDYEERVPVKFIKLVQSKLRAKRPTATNDSLLMDGSFMYGVTFPYSPSQLNLEQIVVPSDLRCKTLIKA